MTNFFHINKLFKYMRFSISNFVHLTPCGSYLLFLGFYCGLFVLFGIVSICFYVTKKRKSVFISETSSPVLFGLALFGIVSTCFYVTGKWKPVFISETSSSTKISGVNFSNSLSYVCLLVSGRTLVSGQKFSLVIDIFWDLKKK